MGVDVIRGAKEDCERHVSTASSVSVYTPQPLRHAVWHGRCDVIVGVEAQRVFGPGMVVVLSRAGLVQRLYMGECWSVIERNARHHQAHEIYTRPSRAERDAGWGCGVCCGCVAGALEVWC